MHRIVGAVIGWWRGFSRKTSSAAANQVVHVFSHSGTQVVTTEVNGPEWSLILGHGGCQQHRDNSSLYVTGRVKGHGSACRARPSLLLDIPATLGCRGQQRDWALRGLGMVDYLHAVAPHMGGPRGSHRVLHIVRVRSHNAIRPVAPTKLAGVLSKANDSHLPSGLGLSGFRTLDGLDDSTGGKPRSKLVGKPP